MEVTKKVKALHTQNKNNHEEHTMRTNKKGTTFNQ